MEENKRRLSWKLFPAEVTIILLGTVGIWLLGSIRQIPMDRLLGACVITLLGLSVTGFHFRWEYLLGRLDYNNSEHIFRFWICIGLGLAVSFACGFLPVAGWPFLLVFVMLALFSNMTSGILSASMLLMIAVILSGETAEVFALYLISGTFAVTLFRHLESDFHFAIPLFLSVFCLLVCETAGIVLAANARPDMEMFVIPVANVIISSILLVGCLKLFSSMVVYQYREKYLDINDTENPVLVELREQDRQEYRYGIHTAYFCERIGAKLKLDVDALKCAGYYHRLGKELEQVMEEKQFPPAAKAILQEYLTAKRQVTKKETAVLLCSDIVVTSMTYLLQKGPDRQVDSDKVIDAIFAKFRDDGTFNQCNITVAELCSMQKIFKEEKLYYDFLR